MILPTVQYPGAHNGLQLSQMFDALATFRKEHVVHCGGTASFLFLRIELIFL